jgi:hypothetical protein
MKFCEVKFGSSLSSAISILGSAINVNILGLGPAILSSAVELALATLR